MQNVLLQSRSQLLPWSMVLPLVLGVNLMLACDLIYAVDTAKFAQSFAKVGLIPDCGGLYFLPKAVGVHKAKELMFTADLIDCSNCS